MNEKSFLEPLEDLLKSDMTFGHRQHVALAWQYLQLTDQLTAENWMRDAIQHVAFKHGAADKYHETITIAWIRLVGTHVRTSGLDNFDEFIAQNSDLLNPHLLGHFYSSKVLQSASARQHWVEPDVAPLPQSGVVE
jgi:hypothetical protein